MTDNHSFRHYPIISMVTDCHTTLKAFQRHNGNYKVHMIQIESCWPLCFCELESAHGPCFYSMLFINQWGDFETSTEDVT